MPTFLYIFHGSQFHSSADDDEDEPFSYSCWHFRNYDVVQFWTVVRQVVLAIHMLYGTTILLTGSKTLQLSLWPCLLSVRAHNPMQMNLRKKTSHKKEEFESCWEWRQNTAMKLIWLLTANKHVSGEKSMCTHLSLSLTYVRFAAQTIDPFESFFFFISLVGVRFIWNLCEKQCEDNEQQIMCYT